MNFVSDIVLMVYSMVLAHVYIIPSATTPAKPCRKQRSEEFSFNSGTTSEPQDEQDGDDDCNGHDTTEESVGTEEI